MKNNKMFAGITVGIALLLFVGVALFMKRAEPEKTVSVPDRSELLVRPHSPVKGNTNAQVTIVEFLDPECEACRAMHPIMKRLSEEYGDRVRVVIRYMPFHGSSLFAASALEEARELGKFDQALDVLFENQPVWGSHHDPKPELIVKYLQGIGIEEKLLGRDYLITKHQWKVDQDAADGSKLGVRATPTFFINGVMLPDIGYEPLKQAIEIALSQSRQG